MHVLRVLGALSPGSPAGAVAVVVVTLVVTLLVGGSDTGEHGQADSPDCRPQDTASTSSWGSSYTLLAWTRWHSTWLTHLVFFVRFQK